MVETVKDLRKYFWKKLIKAPYPFIHTLETGDKCIEATEDAGTSLTKETRNGMKKIVMNELRKDG